MDRDGLKLLIPQIPSLVSTATWHSLGMTATSSKWDLKTALTVQALRNIMGGSGMKARPLGKSQAATLTDTPVKGKTWVAKTTVKAPTPDEESVREAVFQAIEEMKPSDAGVLNYTKPALNDTYVEWVGYRPSAGNEEPLPDVSEQEKYKQMMADPARKSETTILYFHGGAYYLCDPAMYRPMASRLAKESKGRVCNVRYRLAPQAAFPSQLLDGFMIYLGLLYPPPGSMHEAVPAKHIVFGGDSAGGNLSTALLQLLLQLNRKSANATVRFHGKDVPVPLPAGVTASSPWFDLCRAMPSLTTNLEYDYLPPVAHDKSVANHFPKDDIWPTNPPRGDVFCDLSLLDHPLASPLAAESWAGAPPMWISTGQEMLTDEDLIIATRAANQGVKVQLEQYEAMPHMFNMLTPHLGAADRCQRSWGDFCRRCVEESDSMKTNGVLVHVKTEKEEEVSVEGAGKVEWTEAVKMMKDAKRRRIKGYGGEASLMPQPSL